MYVFECRHVGKKITDILVHSFWQYACALIPWLALLRNFSKRMHMLHLQHVFFISSCLLVRELPSPHIFVSVSAHVCMHLYLPAPLTAYCIACMKWPVCMLQVSVSILRSRFLKAKIGSFLADSAHIARSVLCFAWTLQSCTSTKHTMPLSFPIWQKRRIHHPFFMPNQEQNSMVTTMCPEK